MMRAPKRPASAREQLRAPRRGVDHAAPAGAADWILGLQRRAGNRAVLRLLQTRPAAAGARRAVARSRADIQAALRGAEEVLNDRTRLADGFVRSVTGQALEARVSVDKPLRVPKPRLVEIKRSLRRVADRGGASSAEARATLREIERLQEQVRELNAQLRAATNAPPLGGAPPGNSPSHGDGSHAAAQASEGRPSSSGTQSERYDSGKVEEKAATTEEEASRTIVTAELETESEAVKEGEKVAAKEGEKAAAKGGRLYARIAAKIGLELLEALVPDPLDALELMVNFAGAFTEAKAAIRERNLQNGFAIGWAAYLVVPRWEWAKRFAFTTVSRDVATEVLGAAGVAENAFNEGLVRGFMYGEKHTAAQSDLLRQRAFNAVLRSKGHTPGRYDGDDAYTFGPDDVYAFAGAMWPAAVAVLKEADRRRAARLEQERRTKHALASVPSWPR